MLPAGEVLPVAPEGIEPAEEGGDALGNDGGGSGSREPQTASHNQGKVQPNIDKAGNNQEIEGRPAVPKRPKNGGKHIVADRGQHSAAQDGDVGKRLGEDRLRRVHVPQQRPEEEQGEPGHRGGHRHVQHHHSRDGPPEPLLVMGAEMPGHHNAVPAVHADGEVHQQVVEGRRCAHGGNGGVPQAVAHHHRVHHGIELLKDISDKQRDRKGQNQADGVPLCHIPNPHGGLFCCVQGLTPP